MKGEDTSIEGEESPGNKLVDCPDWVPVPAFNPLRDPLKCPPCLKHPLPQAAVSGSICGLSEIPVRGKKVLLLTRSRFVSIAAPLLISVAASIPKSKI